jgi:hypothetical protein
MELDTEMVVAQAIHENHRARKMKDSPTDDPAMAPWEKLPDLYKESNLQQAHDIINKLRRIGCTVKKNESREVVRMAFTKDQIETMAEMEHARWTMERLLGGWKQGKKRDAENRISPYLVPWTALPEHAKEWDRETVRQIPELLSQVGLEIHQA